MTQKLLMTLIACLLAGSIFAQDALKDESLLAMGTPLFEPPKADATPGYRECTLNAEAEAAVKRMEKIAPRSKVWKDEPTQVDKKHMSATAYYKLKPGDYYFCAIHGENINGRAWYDYSGVKGYSKKRERKDISVCNAFYLEEEKSVELWFDSIDRKKACVQIVLINNPQ